MRTHDQTVQQQFDPRAEAYRVSAVHAAGPDLVHAEALVRHAAARTDEALDVGCGAGHLAFTLAPHFGHTVALDPSPSMRAMVSAGALERNLRQIEVSAGQATSLPFDTGRFALVCTRYSAHHWTALEAALQEMGRVLRPGGHALIIDTLAGEDVLTDTYLQAMELLRDVSHVRNRSVGEWRSLLRAAGFAELEYRLWPTHLQFAAWVARMDTPAERIAAIRSLQNAAPREVRDTLAIEEDGSFSIRTALFWLRKAA